MCSGHEIVKQSKEFGGSYSNVDLARPIIMGHEFVGEIIDYGLGSTRPLKVDSRVTSIPVMPPNRSGIIGHVNEHPGGFGELMLLDGNVMMEVTSDVLDDLAALIEPLAVGL